MVLKLFEELDVADDEFESDVISDGTQTKQKRRSTLRWFESDVISDGTQTGRTNSDTESTFESDVISDGTQTINQK